MFILEGHRAYTVIETAEKTGLHKNYIRTQMAKKAYETIRTGQGEMYLSEKGYKQAVEYAKNRKEEPVKAEPKPKKPAAKKPTKRAILDINTSEHGPYIRFRTEQERYYHAQLKRAADKAGVSLATYLNTLLKSALEG